MSRAKDLLEKVQASKNEEIDVSQVISDLITTDFGVDNESQAKAVQLFKGLAFSEDELSNKFMQDLSDLMKDQMNPEDYK